MNLSLDLKQITSSVRAIWEELLERRLWPIALALVVAIIAVPVMLSKPASEPTPLPPAPAATGASPAAAFQPAISTEGKKSSEIRKNLRRFTRKNPFTPQGVNLNANLASGTAEPVQTDLGGAVTAGATGGDSFAPGSTDSGSSGTGTSGSTTTPSAGSTTETFYYHYTASVRFGVTGKEDAKTLNEFRALPSSDNPVIVFMGVRNDGKTAVFLISADSTTTGDGTCKPDDDACTLLYMKKGNVRTIEAVNADNSITEYTLELRDINVERTTAPDEADSSKDGTRRLERTRFRRVVRSIQSLGL
jgi:hypothetical protein